MVREKAKTARPGNQQPSGQLPAAAPLKEWQCPDCGAWIGAGWWRHAHTQDTTPSVDELIAARKRGEDATGYTAKVTVYMRTGKEPMREAPGG